MGRGLFYWDPSENRGVQRDPLMPTSRSNVRALHADAARYAERIPWEEFINRMNWMPGEHVALVGPTGQGKTTVLMNLLPMRNFVTVFATKPRDSSMDALISTGYHKMEAWTSIPAVDIPRRVLWPDASRLDEMVTLQQRVFSDAFAKIYREGGWCVAIDEMWYFVNQLKLDRPIKLFLTQGRALDISLVTATQRPVSVPVEVYDQSTHLFFWRDNDRRNLDRLSEINTRVPARVVRDLVANLDRYQVLYLNTREGTMYRTRAPHPGSSK